MPNGIFWVKGDSKQVTCLGEPILDYEMVPFPILYPDTFETITLKIDNPDYPRTFDDETKNH